MQLWLIQRGKQNEDYRTAGTISDAVRMDYMGSSEFEFGALGESLREFRAEQDRCYLHEVYLRNEQIPVYVYAAFATQELSEYVDLLNKLRYEVVQTKERTEFSQEEIVRHRRNREERRLRDIARGVPKARRYEGNPLTDFWWDITNGVFFTFNKDLADRLPVYLEGSWAKMDANKAKG